MSYLDAAIKSLRTPLCEGRGIKVFRLDEAGTNLYPEGKLRRSKNDLVKNMGLTEVRVMKKGTEVYHGGNMGNTTKHVGENVDQIFSKGTFAKMRKQKISEEGSPDYMYVLQTKYRPEANLKEGADTPLSQVKGNIPVQAKGVDLELKLTRNRNAKNAFNVSITGAGKAVRVIGGASGAATVGETIKRINKHATAARPKVTLRENEGPKYPDIDVQLTGNDGNAFAIMGAVGQALRRAGVSKEEIEEYNKESMSGDYNHLLQTAMKWVNVG